MRLPYHRILLFVVAQLGASAIGMALRGRLGERRKSRKTVRRASARLVHVKVGAGGLKLAGHTRVGQFSDQAKTNL